MMFERFADTARRVVVQAEEDAGRLGHDYIGCEHLLLAAAAADEPASAVLRDHGVTPERVEVEVLRTIGRGPMADPLSGLDRQALASIGIDLDAVRARIEALFGPDALTGAHLPARRSRRPRWEKGPLAALTRRRRRCRAGRDARLTDRRGDALLLVYPAPGGNLRFTARAKKSLAASLREAQALHDNYIGVQHLVLALLALEDGVVPAIVSALGTPATSLRAAVLARYRNAS
jgi:ATP-dependent Clp protease ATP-binding subunit ClpA